MGKKKKGAVKPLFDPAQGSDHAQYRELFNVVNV
jgi:hypothetical protein